jgi:hypothetical protein
VGSGATGVERGSAWAPAVAWAGGTLWVADVYQTGSYRIHIRPVRSSVPGLVEVLGESERFAVNPSLAVSSEGQPVVAWEEADAIWGRVPFGSDRNAATVAANRRIRTAFKSKDGWRELPRPRKAYLGTETFAPDAQSRFGYTRKSPPLVPRTCRTRSRRSDFQAAVERWNRT